MENLEESLFTISIEGINYFFSQNKVESVMDFKTRLQKDFDSKNINIKVV